MDCLGLIPCRALFEVPDLRDDMQRAAAPAEISVWEAPGHGQGHILDCGAYRHFIRSIGAQQN